MMKSYVETVLALCESQVGYHEKASNNNLNDFDYNQGANNYTKYARDLDTLGYWNSGTSKKQGFEWCTVFCQWTLWMSCGKDVNRLRDLACVPKTGENLSAGAIYWKQYFEKAGRFSQTPHLGDVIFITTNQQTKSADHVGFVTDISADGEVIYTTEGNKNNQVDQCKYAKGYWKILGFGTPRYDSTQTQEQLDDIKAEYNKKISELNAQLEDSEQKLQTIKIKVKDFCKDIDIIE